MRQQELDRFIKDFLDRWNSHDIDRIMDLMVDDCIFEPSSQALGRCFSGRKPVRGAITALFELIPDIQWQAVRCFSSGELVVAEVLATGTQEGVYFETPGCDVLTLREGRVVAKRAYRKV